MVQGSGVWRSGLSRRMSTMYSRLQNLQNSGRLFASVSGSILAIFLLQNGQVTLPFSAGNIIPERVLTCKKNHPLPKDNIVTKAEKI